MEVAAQRVFVRFHLQVYRQVLTNLSKPACIFNFLLYFMCFGNGTSDLLLKTIERYKSEDPQLVVHTHSPIRTTKLGQFVDIVKLDPMQHGHHINLRNARDELNSSTAIKDGNHEVYFDLGYSDGSPLSGVRLQLKRNYKLVSQTYAVEEIARERKIRKKHNFLEDCHYNGFIHNHNGYSKAAISLCNGLVSCFYFRYTVLL